MEDNLIGARCAFGKTWISQFPVDEKVAQFVMIIYLSPQWPDGYPCPNTLAEELSLYVAPILPAPWRKSSSVCFLDGRPC